MEIKKVNILGTEYVIKEFSSTDNILDSRLSNLNVNGFTDSWDKVIGYIRYDKEDEEETGSCKNLTEYSNKVLRHEIIHAFLFESGLSDNSQKIEVWATNEEMVDFFALQLPKMYDVFLELGIL